MNTNVVAVGCNRPSTVMQVRKVAHLLALVVARNRLHRSCGNERLHEASPEVPALLVRAASCIAVIHASKPIRQRTDPLLAHAAR